MASTGLNKLATPPTLQSSGADADLSRQWLDDKLRERERKGRDTNKRKRQTRNRERKREEYVLKRFAERQGKRKERVCKRQLLGNSRAEGLVRVREFSKTALLGVASNYQMFPLARVIGTANKSIFGAVWHFSEIIAKATFVLGQQSSSSSSRYRD